MSPDLHEDSTKILPNFQFLNQQDPISKMRKRTLISMSSLKPDPYIMI